MVNFPVTKQAAKSSSELTGKPNAICKWKYCEKKSAESTVRLRDTRLPAREKGFPIDNEQCRYQTFYIALNFLRSLGRARTSINMCIDFQLLYHFNATSQQSWFAQQLSTNLTNPHWRSTKWFIQLVMPERIVCQGSGSQEDGSSIFHLIRTNPASRRRLIL